MFILNSTPYEHQTNQYINDPRYYANAQPLDAASFEQNIENYTPNTQQNSYSNIKQAELLNDNDDNDNNLNNNDDNDNVDEQHLNVNDLHNYEHEVQDDDSVIAAGKQ